LLPQRQSENSEETLSARPSDQVASPGSHGFDRRVTCGAFCRQRATRIWPVATNAKGLTTKSDFVFTQPAVCVKALRGSSRPDCGSCNYIKSKARCRRGRAACGDTQRILMRTRLTFIATLLLVGIFSPAIPGFDVHAADQRGRDREARSFDSAVEAEVLRLDQKIADAVVHGDTAYVPADFVMVHGDGWTNGGKPLATDTKETMLQRVTSKYYDVIDFDSVKAEMHGDIAITYGRYIAHTTGGAAADKRWFSVWFERVYAKRDGKWMYLSHRTVHGPTFGVDRESVRDK
jgi:hypothetical protein